MKKDSYINQEQKRQISVTLDIILSYFKGYFLGLIAGLTILIGSHEFGKRPTSTFLTIVSIILMAFINIQNFKKKRNYRYGMLIGTLFTGVVTVIFGQFYSDIDFMFGYSFAQVTIVLIHTILQWGSYVFHIKIFYKDLTDVKLNKWIWLIFALLVISNSNIVGLVKSLVGGSMGQIFIGG